VSGKCQLIERCVKSEPVCDVLTDGEDELMAEMLALHKSVRGAVKAGKRKFSQRQVYKVFRGEASGGPKRSELFRGRVHFKILEIAEEMKARRDLLLGDAFDVYGEALRRQGRHNPFKGRASLSLKAAHDVVFGLGAFKREHKVSLQDESGQAPGERMDKDELQSRVERALGRKRPKGKAKQKKR